MSAQERLIQAMAAAVVIRAAEGLLPESWQSTTPLIVLADKRLEEGAAEHAGTADDWENWTVEQFRGAIDQELADAFNYARRALQRGMSL